MACANTDRSQYGGCARRLGSSVGAHDKLPAPLVQPGRRATPQQSVALATNNVTRRMIPFSEQPGLVVKNARIKIAARSPQPQFEFPDLADCRHDCRFEPTDA